VCPGRVVGCRRDRRHVVDYKPWLAARPGQNKPRVTSATIAHRLGTLRMFFVRIQEWGWDEAPTRVPMFNGDLPKLDHPLPKALDDAAAAKLLRAAQADRKLLVRVTVEMLLRTGLRVSAYTTLPADAIVQIGAAPWLHVPVGKLHDDRYLPLHPNLVTLIDEYRTRYVPEGHPLLLPRPNGSALDRHAVTRMINRAGKAAGLPHIHPHQLRHTLATQAKVGGIASGASFSDANSGALFTVRHSQGWNTAGYQFQPRHEPGGDRRHARAPQHGHDHALRQDRQQHRRRRVLRRHRQGRRPLRPTPTTTGRCDRTEDGPAPA